MGGLVALALLWVLLVPHEQAWGWVIVGVTETREACEWEQWVRWPWQRTVCVELR